MSDLDTLPPLADVTFEPADSDTSDVPVGEDGPKRTRRPRSDKGKPRGPRGAANTKDRKLADDLLGPWGIIIKALAVPMPTVAAVMSKRAEKSTAAIVALAPPKLKAQLERVSKVGPAGDLAETVAMMIVAGMLDIGKLEPGTPLAMLTGVQELFDLTHEPVPQDPGEQSFPTAPVTTVSPYPGAM